MRISTDPKDPAYVDGRARRAYLNGAEVTGWIVADEFRRCVVTAAGVMNGSVSIERLDDEPAEEAPAAIEPMPSNSMSGVFVSVPDKPVIAPLATVTTKAPRKARAKPAAKPKRGR